MRLVSKSQIRNNYMVQEKIRSTEHPNIWSNLGENRQVNLREIRSILKEAIKVL